MKCEIGCERWAGLESMMAGYSELEFPSLNPILLHVLHLPEEVGLIEQKNDQKATPCRAGAMSSMMPYVL